MFPLSCFALLATKITHFVASPLLDHRMTMAAARGSEADFLMEQLLDSQEEVAQLHDEVAKWKAAASLRNAASSLNRVDNNDIDILLSLRESLNVSLQQLDQDIGRLRATAAGGSDDGLEGSHQSSEAMLMFPKLRYELLLFRNVTELERLYRTGIRIGFDAPRILRLALEKLSQLTNQWALFQQDGNERHVSTGSLRSPVPSSLPSYCYSKEWAVPFRKALTEVIISLEMMPQQQSVSLASSRLTLSEDAMRQLRLMGENEKILVELARQTVDFDTDAIREKIKLASSTVSSSLGTSATTAASGASGLPSPSLNMAAGGKQSSNTSAPNSRSGSATGTPSAASIRSNSAKKGVSGRPATMSYLQSIQLGNKRTNSSRSSSAATKPPVDASVMSTSSTASAARGRSPPRHEFSTMQSVHTHISTEAEAVVKYQPSQQASVAALPPRAPGGASLGYSTPVPAAQIGGVDSKHPNSRSTSAASLVDSRAASPSNLSVNSSRGVAIGRTTPTKPMDVPRRIVLKSPSPKPNRSAAQRPLAEAIVDHGLALSPGDHFSQARTQELPPHASPPQQRASPPRSALKHWAETHEDEHHHHHHEGGSGKRVTLSVPRNSAQGNDFDLSPQSPATSPPKPLQYYEVMIPSRELSAEQPVRRREPQPTKVAPATSTPASHPSPGGRQVRFAGDN
ncbi:unnamed protein product [Bodo saltans]|uniref:GPI-anchored surface protein n=1 Tax=Bodo saltans TaxID=75058 RepID=A0A0S4JV79_BODSA|nr:unnamed protein product [Bodo saltans]|eukprot:CUG94213.1 unnamed protein product [Bodo saltans]